MSKSALRIAIMASWRQFIASIATPLLMYALSFIIVVLYGNNNSWVRLVDGETSDWISSFQSAALINCILCAIICFMVPFISARNEKFRDRRHWWILFIIEIFVVFAASVATIYIGNEIVLARSMLGVGIALVWFLIIPILTYLVSTSQCSVLWKNSFRALPKASVKVDELEE